MIVTTLVALRANRHLHAPWLFCCTAKRFGHGQQVRLPVPRVKYAAVPEAPPSVLVRERRATNVCRRCKTGIRGVEGAHIVFAYRFAAILHERHPGIGDVFPGKTIVTLSAFPGVGINSAPLVSMWRLIAASSSSRLIAGRNRSALRARACLRRCQCRVRKALLAAVCSSVTGRVPASFRALWRSPTGS